MIGDASNFPASRKCGIAVNVSSSNRAELWRQGSATIAGRAQTAVRFGNAGHLGRETPRHRGACILGAVVDDDNLERSERLGQHAFEGGGEAEKPGTFRPPFKDRSKGLWALGGE